ncbi:MAG TPA: class I SAM-dependent methyltransferase [Herpetosiphonaceae bacterium]
MRTTFARSIFRLIQLIILIVLLPFAVAGYIIFVVKLVIHSRRTGTSATVLASLYTRYMQHKLGTRHDDAAERLLLAMPSVSPLALHLVTAPTLVSHRVTGHVPKIYRYPYPGTPTMQHQSAARTTYYDAALQQHLPDIKQFVMLGAGFDTRAYRLSKDTHVRCFEVDTPQTQAFKREMLRQADIDTAGVIYVPTSFQENDWFEKLLVAGFDPNKPSLFTWESVTMYLDQEAVERTLRTIAGTAAGTVVAFDYFAAELVTSPSPFMRYARAVIKLTGEPFRFGIDNTRPVRERVAEFLASCGLVLEEQRNFGVETAHQRAMAGFATARVP